MRANDTNNTVSPPKPGRAHTHFQPKDKTLNTNLNHPARSSRSTAIRVCVAFGVVASVTAAGSMTPATATFRDPGPGSVGAAVSQAKTTNITYDAPGVSFPYVDSPCFAGRMPDRWAADVGAQQRCVHIYGASPTFSISAGGRAAGPVAHMIDINTYERFVEVWPMVDPIEPGYPRRF